MLVRQGCCTEDPVEADWAAFSAPEAGGARGRALLEAQGADTASPTPAPLTGSHKHCLLSPLLGNRKKSGFRPLPSAQTHLPSWCLSLPVLGSLSRVSGPFSSLTPS